MMGGQPLHICMLSSKFYARSDMGGGLERSARRLCQELLAAGHRVFVLTRNYDGLPRREIIDGVEVHRFPVWGRSQVMISLSYLVQSVAWLILHRHDYQVIHCHQSYAPATVGGIAKLLLGKPVVVKISTADEFSERAQLEQLPGFRVRRFLLRRADRIVVVSRQAGEEFTGLGIARSKIVHIPNGVPLPSQTAEDLEAKQAARERLGLSGEPIVLFVGRLSTEKNLSTLIEAWPEVLSSHPKAHLLLVGDGGTFRNAEPALRDQVTRLRLEHSVHFVGRVSDVCGFLLAADLFVLPSSTEGMSNALLEAMAAGLPIVATRIPGNCELIADGDNGLLVERQNPQALAAAIARVLASPEVAHRLGAAARRTVKQRFVIERVGRTYQGLYQELLERSSR